MDVKALYRLSYGMYVVSSKNGEAMNGQIVNTVFQVAAQPQIIAVSINKQNLTHEFIQNSRVLTISILSESTSLEFVGRFGFRSGRDIDKFDSVAYRTGSNGAPIVLDNTVAYLEGAVVGSFDSGTHTVFFARVVDAGILKEDEKSLTYAEYRKIKGSATPETAPTYVKSVAKD